jgi:hypothetical protein
MVQTVTVGSPPREIGAVTVALVVAVLATAGWVVLQSALVFRPLSSAASAVWPEPVGAAAWVMPGAALLAVAALGCAAGLLMRLEWARRLLVALLTGLALANLGALWLQHAWGLAVLEALAQSTGLHGVARGVLDLLLTAARLLGLTLTLLTCTALGWVIVQLMSRRVRRECE